MITKADVKAAKMIIKWSTNPKEIEHAQDVLKRYKKQESERFDELLDDSMVIEDD